MNCVNLDPSRTRFYKNCAPHEIVYSRQLCNIVLVIPKTHWVYFEKWFNGIVKYGTQEPIIRNDGRSISEKLLSQVDKFLENIFSLSPSRFHPVSDWNISWTAVFRDEKHRNLLRFKLPLETGERRRAESNFFIHFPTSMRLP